MCICFYTLLHPSYSLVLITNRDEFLARPTEAADWRGRGSATLCGLDVQGGGTWFGLEKQHGRFGLLTNVREEVSSRSRSRGKLVLDWLDADTSVSLDQHQNDLRASMMDYAGFNLLSGQIRKDGNIELGFVSNRAQHVQTHTPGKPADGADCLRDLENEGGPGVMSNGALACSLDAGSSTELEQAWPKMTIGRKAFQAVIDKHDKSDSQAGRQAFIDELFEVLNIAYPNLKDKEDVRSTILVTPFDMFPGKEAWYATRAQTVLLVERGTGKCTFVERQAYEISDGEPAWNGSVKSWTFGIGDL